MTTTITTHPPSNTGVPRSPLVRCRSHRNNAPAIPDTPRADDQVRQRRAEREPSYDGAEGNPPPILEPRRYQLRQTGAHVIKKDAVDGRSKKGGRVYYFGNESGLYMYEGGGENKVLRIMYRYCCGEFASCRKLKHVAVSRGRRPLSAEYETRHFCMHIGDT